MRTRKYTYIPNSEIESITTWNGKEFKGSQLLDGAYAKGNVKMSDGGVMTKGGMNEMKIKGFPKKVPTFKSKIKGFDYKLNQSVYDNFSDAQLTIAWYEFDSLVIGNIQFKVLETARYINDKFIDNNLPKADLFELSELITTFRDDYNIIMKKFRKFAEGGVMASEKKYGVVEESTNRILIKSADKSFIDLKYKELKEVYDRKYPNEKISIIEFAEGGVMAKGGSFDKSWVVEFHQNNGGRTKVIRVKAKTKSEAIDKGFMELSNMGENSDDYSVAYSHISKYAEGGVMAKGGETKISHQIPTGADMLRKMGKRVTLSFDGSKSKLAIIKQHIENMWYFDEENFADYGNEIYFYNVEFRDAESIRNWANKKFDDVEVSISHNGKEYAEGGVMAKGGYASRHRKRTLEEKAEDLVGSATWHSLDRHSKADVISEMVTQDIIPIKGAKGLMVSEKFVVKFTLSNGEIVIQTYDTKEKMDDGIADMYFEKDIIDVKVEEPIAKEEKKSIFETARKVETKSKSTKEKKGVEVDGIEGDISRYDELKSIINNAKAEQEVIGGRIKEIGKEKFLELYEMMKSKPENFNLVDGDEKIMFIVMDKYKKVEPEKEAILEQYDGLLEKVTTYSFNSEVLDRVGDVINKLIMNSKDISEEDKKKLLVVDTSIAIKKGSIDRLMQYDNPEEVFNLIEPILALK